MIEENAVVKLSEGEYAQVLTEQKSACNSCAAKDGCSTAAVAEAVESAPGVLRARNPIGAKTGERVVIGIEEVALTKISMAFYALPLVCLILFALLGQFIAPLIGASAEPMSALGGLAGLIFGLWLLQRIVNRMGGNEHYEVTILRRAGGIPVTVCVKDGTSG